MVVPRLIQINAKFDKWTARRDNGGVGEYGQGERRKDGENGSGEREGEEESDENEENGSM